MNAKDVLGRAGEQAAVSYLEGCGFRILDRNWRSADGEIDIVAVERQDRPGRLRGEDPLRHPVRHPARRGRPG